MVVDVNASISRIICDFPPCTVVKVLTNPVVSASVEVSVTTAFPVPTPAESVIAVTSISEPVATLTLSR